jgi:hypothetical protein
MSSLSVHISGEHISHMVQINIKYVFYGMKLDITLF